MSVDDELRPLVDLDADSIRCPYPHYERIREVGPVAWSHEQQHFVVTGYDEILAILRDPATFSNQSAGSSPKADADMFRLSRSVPETDELRELRRRNRHAPRLATVLAGTDPPVHDRHRSLVNRAFTPRRVAALEPRLREVADELIDQFIDAGQVEFVGQFAMPMASIVMAGQLGVERDGLPMLRRGIEDLARPQGNSRMTADDFVAVLRAKLDLTEYFEDVLRARRGAPRDDMISRIVSAAADGDALDEAEQLGVVMQLLGAGVKTSSKLMANAMSLLVADAALMSIVRADGDRLADLLEEVLRVEAPVQGLFRTATSDANIGGVDIPAGASLWLVYAAANRDRRVFADPERVDLDRSRSTPHLSFGHGIHHCIGASLARSEARIGLGRVLARLGAIESAGEPPDVERSYILHGVKSLPLRFTAA